MKITLVSHASVIIETSDAVIWTDPWLFGKAFNDSWSLFPEASFDQADLNRITHVWVSHEHPDHFHLPTLRSLPDEFKRRVSLLFQKNNSDKMPNAFRNLGFTNIMLMPNRKILQITPETRVYCSQIGHMDSCLGVLNLGDVLMNLNDCEATSTDYKTIKKDLGKVDILLNQFSLAGYGGQIDRDAHLPPMASQILQNMIDGHRDMGAKVTIPFASFIYFSCEDNRYMNKYANKVHDVQKRLDQEGLTTAILFPGDVFDSNVSYDSTKSLARFQDCYETAHTLDYEKASPVPISKIREAYFMRFEQLNKVYPKFVLRRLKPIKIYIPDLDVCVEVSFSRRWFEGTSIKHWDVSICSQPLHLCFFQPFGLQTLGVGARCIVKNNYPMWKRYRILFSMNNSEFYLKPKYLFTRKNITFFKERLNGGLNQLRYRLSLMK